MPIAINLSYAFNVDTMPFIITVILASNISFCHPFGYQTNLLVMAPGHYKFHDYVKCGIPLTILTWIIYIFLFRNTLAIELIYEKYFKSKNICLYYNINLWRGYVTKKN